MNEYPGTDGYGSAPAPMASFNPPPCRARNALLARACATAPPQTAQAETCATASAVTSAPSAIRSMTSGSRQAVAGPSGTGVEVVLGGLKVRPRTRRPVL